MASATTKFMRSLDAEFQSIFTGVNAEPPRQVLVFDFVSFNPNKPDPGLNMS